MDSSPCRKKLNEGNEHYRRSQSPIPAPLIPENGKAALKCYNEAVGVAATPAEKSSAQKNAAKAAWVVAQSDEEPAAVRLFHFKECIDHCNAALSLVTTGEGEGTPLARAGKEAPWLEDLCVFTHTVLTQTLCFEGDYTTHGHKTPLQMLEVEVHNLRNCVTFRLSVGMALLAKVHKKAVLAKEEGDLEKVFEWVSCHASLADSLEETLKRSLRVLPVELEELVELRSEEVTDLLDSWRHTHDDASATNALRGAHALRKDAKDGNHDFETMAYKSFMAIDAYHQVASYKRSASEAEAEACIGMIQQDVFKSMDNAARHYSTAVHVALSCAPVSFEGVPWFQRARRELAKRQEARQQEEAKAKDKERAPYLELLKADLEAIKAAQDKGAYELLKLLYEKYEAEFGDKHVAEDKLPKSPDRKDIMKACLPFHPDKHGDKERKTQILYEEITKALTAELNTMKGH